MVMISLLIEAAERCSYALEPIWQLLNLLSNFGDQIFAGHAALEYADQQFISLLAFGSRRHPSHGIRIARQNKTMQVNEINSNNEPELDLMLFEGEFY